MIAFQKVANKFGVERIQIVVSTLLNIIQIMLNPIKTIAILITLSLTLVFSGCGASSAEMQSNQRVDK